jgi:hypothetical protein
MSKQWTYFQHMPLLAVIESVLLDPASQMQSQLEQKWSGDQVLSVLEACQSLRALQKDDVYQWKCIFLIMRITKKLVKLEISQTDLISEIYFVKEQY